MSKTFIIEHLEPRMFPWCLIEYERIAKTVGRKNLLVTNVQKRDLVKVRKFGRAVPQRVFDLVIESACVLDPKAKEALTPAEAKKFEVFIFGGILGDAPERERTKKLLTSKLGDLPARNLGLRQMSTDNAVLAVSLILKGRTLESLQFQDTLEVKLKRGVVEESIQLPFRYIVQKGKPFVSKKLIEYLKKKKDL